MATSFAMGLSERKSAMVSVGLLVVVMEKSAFAQDARTWKSQGLAARVHRGIATIMLTASNVFAA